MFLKLKQAHTRTHTASEGENETKRERERSRKKESNWQTGRLAVPRGPEAQTQNLQLTGDAPLFAEAAAEVPF